MCLRGLPGRTSPAATTTSWRSARGRRRAPRRRVPEGQLPARPRRRLARARPQLLPGRRSRRASPRRDKRVILDDIDARPRRRRRARSASSRVGRAAPSRRARPVRRAVRTAAGDPGRAAHRPRACAFPTPRSSRSRVQAAIVDGRPGGERRTRARSSDRRRHRRTRHRGAARPRRHAGDPARGARRARRPRRAPGSSDGFRFDTGPSWYLMPEVFDHFFRLLGTSAAEQLDLTLLDPGYRVYFEGDDGRRSTSRASARRERRASSSGRAGRRRARSSATSTPPRRRYDDRASTLPLHDLRRRSGRSLAPEVLAARRPARPPARRAARPLRGAAPCTTRGCGRSSATRPCSSAPRPIGTPAMYHLMSHLDLDDGVLLPAGRVRARHRRASPRLARERGRRDHHATPGSTAIELTDDGAHPSVTGVRLPDARGPRIALAADGSSRPPTCTTPRPSCCRRGLRTYPESWWSRRTSGPGAVLVMLGVRGELPELAHHTLFFTEDWRDELRRASSARPAHPRPRVVLRLQAERDRPDGRAPRRQRTCSCSCPCPPTSAIGRGGDGRRRRPARRGGRGSRHRADRRVGGHPRPRRAHRGAPHRRARRLRGRPELVAGRRPRPAHTLRQSAFLRGTQRVAPACAACSTPAGRAIPGIGLPMCLISAEIVAQARARRPLGRAARRAGRPRPAPAAVDRSPDDGLAYLAGLLVSLGAMVAARRALAAVLLARARRAAVVRSASGVALLPRLGPRRHRPRRLLPRRLAACATGLAARARAARSRSRSSSPSSATSRS